MPLNLTSFWFHQSLLKSPFSAVNLILKYAPEKQSNIIREGIMVSFNKAVEAHQLKGDSCECRHA